MSTDTPKRQIRSTTEPGSNGDAPVQDPVNEPSVDSMPRANGSGQENGKAGAVQEPVAARIEGRETPAGDLNQAGDSTTGRPGAGTATTVQANEWAEFSTLSGDSATALTGSSAQTSTRVRTVPWFRIDDRFSRIVLSAVLAILLWIYVVSLENPTQNTQFPNINVELRAVGSNLKAVITPETVDANVQAPQNVLSGLRRADVHAYVDLTGVGEGVHNVPVRADIVNGHADEVNIRFNPSNVQVQIALQSSRVLSVSVETQGTPAFGYALETSQVSPSEVKVSGNQDDVVRISRLVATVDVDGKAGTQQGTKVPLALDANGQEIKGLTFDPATVEVAVPMKLLLNYKTVPVRAPLVGQPAPGYQVSSIEQDPTNVTVCCSPTVLEPVQFLNAEPVSITGTTSTLITRTNLILPANVDLYPGQPRQITVTVHVEVMETTLQVSVAPAVEGLPDGWSALPSPNKLDLTLAGTFAQLQNLSPADLKAIINVQGKGAGTYQIKPQVIVPQGIKVDLTNPDTVTVTLTEPTPTPTATPSRTPTPPPTPTREQAVFPPSPSPRTATPEHATAVPTSPAAPTPTATPTPGEVPAASPTPQLSPAATP